ncbi:MAG: AAA family ATPase [Candidatus Obscuribacterales bacterium]|nr:AAA family ATPase [Candidatus Obscuribacterales bacterium]
MLQLIRMLLKKRTTKSAEKIEATTAPPPSPNPNGDSTAEAEPDVPAEIAVTAPEISELTTIDSAAVITPPPLPQICEPREVDLYQPSEKETQFAEWLSERIIGQPKAIEALVGAYRAHLNPIRDLNKPICTLMFAGPSRVGKTLCAQRLAEYFHGRRDAYIKVDGGDYIDKANLTKLVGASAQWVGYQKPNEKIPEGVMDTSALLSSHNLITSRKGSSANVTIVLIDEIEKACTEFFQLFLSILDVANATMGNNQKVDYGQCIFIMTSNLGMDRVEKEMSRPIGLGATEPEVLNESKIGSLIDKCMKERFLPEFRNRIDALVVFSHLTRESMRKIVDVEITDLEKHLHSSLGERKFDLEIDASAREFVLSEALKSKGNVSNLKRVLNKHLSAPLGTGIINNAIGCGQTVSVTHKEGDRLSFTISGNTNAATQTNPVTQSQPQETKEVIEARKLWEQATKDHNANLIDLAISNLQAAIAILQSTNGTHSLRLAQLYNRLALYYAKKGDQRQEIASYIRALSERRQATTADNINELTELPTIYGNLGITYTCSGQREKAREIFEEGMAHCKQYRDAYKGGGNVPYFLFRYAQFDNSKLQELFEFAASSKTKP